MGQGVEPITSASVPGQTLWFSLPLGRNQHHLHPVSTKARWQPWARGAQPWRDHTWPKESCCSVLQSLPGMPARCYHTLSLRGKLEGWIFMRTLTGADWHHMGAGGFCPGSWAVEDFVSKEWKWDGSLRHTHAWPMSNPSAEACWDSGVLLGGSRPPSSWRHLLSSSLSAWGRRHLEPLRSPHSHVSESSGVRETI